MPAAKPHRPYAKRLADIEPFHVMVILERARQLEADGRDIVHLEVGEPDFSTAEPIILAGETALARGYTHYTQAVGMRSLRERIGAFYQSDYGVEVDPDRIVVTSGASGALILATALLVNPGDGLLMTDPGYPCNRHFLRAFEGEGQLVAVGPEDNYQLHAAKAEQHWRDNTIGAMVASPANPTGAVLSHEQLSALWALCESRQGHLIVDEIYHGLCYDQPAPSILQVTDQAFVINSFSKYFGMTGWRLGWLVAPPEAIPALEKLAQNLFIAPSTPAQHAALAAFNHHTRAILNVRRDELKKRRDYLTGALRKLGFDIPCQPQGALYIYAGIKAFASDSQQFCLDLLEQHGVAVTPGCDFGQFQADTHVRFAFTTTMNRMQEGIKRLQQALR